MVWAGRRGGAIPQTIHLPVLRTGRSLSKPTSAASNPSRIPQKGGGVPQFSNMQTASPHIHLHSRSREISRPSSGFDCKNGSIFLSRLLDTERGDEASDISKQASALCTVGIDG